MTDAPEVDAVPAEPTDATDSPGSAAMRLDAAGGDQDAGELAEALLASFRRQLEGQLSISSSVVQDHLLDLWGLLPEGDIRTEVERWLTETLERSLYEVSDVDARLATVLPPA